MARKALNVSLQLLDTDKKIRKEIRDILAKKFNIAVRKGRGPLVNELKTLVPDWLAETPVIRDLQSGGALLPEIGLPFSRGQSAADEIIHAVVESVEITVHRLDGKLRGGVTVYIQPGDFMNVMGISEATIDTGKTSLPWLDWLLTAGSKVIVRDYKIEYGSFPRKSRTGQAIMVKSNKVPYWRMPTLYAGTISNNFITQAFEEKEPQFEALVRKHIIKRVK